MGDRWIMGLIGIGLAVWIGYAIRHYMRTPEAMENVCLSDRYPQDDEIVSLIESAGYEIIGGKYFVPIRIQMDGEELESAKLWIDMVVKRGEQWYIVRIARERMQLDWSASAIRRHWGAYFAAYPECDGLLVVDMAERRIRMLHMEFGDAEA
ncbi:DNA-binding protein [Paenibacillus alvei]|uniref:Uncharacterized protein n=1 Tax=Paenibacillus alvei TaxID=44250 RepID=A0A383RD60_PAEAL|nr:DNA-binding protein [Paenibacillus alvei]SYX84773.1 conserved protein of unknown function [Paenibacillus alvei]